LGYPRTINPQVIFFDTWEFEIGSPAFATVCGRALSGGGLIDDAARPERTVLGNFDLLPGDKLFDLSAERLHVLPEEPARNCFDLGDTESLAGDYECAAGLIHERDEPQPHALCRRRTPGELRVAEILLMEEPKIRLVHSVTPDRRDAYEWPSWT